MKRRQRRPVLELNQSQSSSHPDHLQNKWKHVSNDHHGQDVPANPLANLLCHYNSDSDNEETKRDCKLDDQVNNFFKEIQLIAPKQSDSSESSDAALATNSNPRLTQINQSALKWRECLDESSGYPYYWHIETNEVTWEMPEELRYYKNNVKTGAIAKPPPVHDSSHWVDFSSVTYQQSHENIPEGMIPREVVARNRNRYICNETISRRQESQTEQEAANASDNDSDDGKIEMITSYGSEESDSDTDEGQSKNDASNDSKGSRSTKSNEAFPSPAVVMQPLLPTVSQNPKQEHETKGIAEESRVESDSKLVEDSEAKYLKNAVQENNESVENYDGRTVKSKLSVESDIDFRISLVPGYDEESDAEEESEVKQERKALFPIPQTEETVDVVVPRKMITDEKTRDSNDGDTDIEKRDAQEQNNEELAERLEGESKIEEDVQKGNKFLDNLHGRSKFQRKRRIAFDVPSKPSKVSDNESNKSETDAQREETNTYDEYTVEPAVEQQEKSNPENVEENVPSFKDDSTNTEEETKVQPDEDSKEEEEEVNSLSQVILEKLKFLSEGKPAVSPVQTMSIRLQTLFVAWEAGCLEKDYLRRWLTETSHELERLEQDAAPLGWLCQWDRSHKRYYYQNTTTGVTQWTYPDTGIAGGAEEMEICSTPPPTDQEEMIIPAEDEKSKPKKSQEDGESNEATITTRSSDMEAPPPPQISNPSPPPPPRIYAEDLKKDLKRKQDKCNEVKLDSKKQRSDEGTAIAEAKQLENSVVPTFSSALVSPQPSSIASVTTAEPLPPGVDLTEAPYEIPTTALKRIIYGVQPQAGALYEAAARDPTTVPILSHPAAIVQEHYLQYPYHQHLHAAPAALVLPHKHSVQPAIQLIADYTPIYTNHKVIEKPPVKTAKESLVSALDSFYNDIARIENVGTEVVPQRQDSVTSEPASLPQVELKPEMEPEPVPVETPGKEKRRKRTRIGISKKHKEVSSMVAKWQKVQQNFENT
ncbi:formin-binding protein 4-like [Ceratina calcarata]|uniref:Formin-binding protein 4-like n=1 Tax=Ceratina calcarata TaxID=156304 RepID=A0AAJ7JGM0_9HYME|nr:formin-binding protein 4-like [Ceratina calcarata]XP_017893061.1 formin-binding protein 4-like [Ceratina calcarata]